MPTTGDPAASSDSQREAVNKFDAAIQEFFSNTGLYFTDMRKTGQILERIAGLAGAGAIVSRSKVDELRAFSEHYKKIGAFELELPAEGESKVEKLCEQSQRIIDHPVLKQSEMAIVISQATNNRLSVLLNEIAENSESNPELMTYLNGDNRAPRDSYERSPTKFHTDRAFQTPMRRSMLVDAVAKHARKSGCVSPDEMERLERIKEGFTSRAAEFDSRTGSVEARCEDLQMQLSVLNELRLENGKSKPHFSPQKLADALSTRFYDGTEKDKLSSTEKLIKVLFTETETSWHKFKHLKTKARQDVLNTLSERVHRQFEARQYVSGALLESCAPVSSSSEQPGSTSPLQDTDSSDEEGEEYNPDYSVIEEECSVTVSSGQALKETMCAGLSSSGFFSGNENKVEQRPAELNSVIETLKVKKILDKELEAVLKRTPYTTWREITNALDDIGLLDRVSVGIIADDVQNMLAQGRTEEDIKQKMVSTARVLGVAADGNLHLSHKHIRKITTRSTHDIANLVERLAPSNLLTKHNFLTVFHMTEASLKSLDSKFPLNQKLAQKDFDAAIKAVASKKWAESVNASLEPSRRIFRK